MVTEERHKEIRAMVDKVEAERMEWIGKTIDGLVARGVPRERICVDMTDDKLCLAIGVDRKLVADCEIVLGDDGLRFVGRVHRNRGSQKRVLGPQGDLITKVTVPDPLTAWTFWLLGVGCGLWVANKLSKLEQELQSEPIGRELPGRDRCNGGSG